MKNLFGLSGQHSLADMSGRMSKYLIQLDYCVACNDKKPSAELDCNGYCTRCSKIEAQLSERLVEHFGIVNDKLLSETLSDYLKKY